MDIDKLNKWADLLLDTGKRNNLINFKDSKIGTVEIILPDFDTIFSMAEHSTIFEVLNPVLDEEDFIDDQLKKNDDQKKPILKEDYIKMYEHKVKKSKQVLLFNPFYNPIKALKNIGKKAKTALEETGVNIAYMAFGFIHWKENENSDSFMCAPVLLAPILIENDSAINPYYIKITDNDIIVNPTFSFKLKNDYGIELPEYDDESIDEYLNKVYECISKLKWTITKECKIGIFSFLKINMYKDLKDNAQTILKNNEVRSLLGEFDTNSTSNDAKDKTNDQIPIQLHNVVDADSSQTEAIQMALSGKSFVLQGPPGTGKSQTITNIISEFLAGGKKVLFVSEKLAALNVVYDKLKKAGLEEFCLELHSHKANKKDVIDELCHTLKTQKSTLSDRAQKDIEKKFYAQQELDAYTIELHKVRPTINKSLYNLYEEVASYRKTPNVEFIINEIKTKGEKYLNEVEILLMHFSKYIASIGYDYHQNVWYGYNDLHFSYQSTAQLKFDLKDVLSLCTNLKEFNEKLTDKYHIVAKNIYQAYALRDFFDLAKKSEFITPKMLNSSNVDSILKTIKSMNTLAKEILNNKKIIDNMFDEDVYKLDGQILYKKLIKQYNKSYIRLFSSDYRHIAKELKLCKKDNKKIKYKVAVSMIDYLRVYQQKTSLFNEFEEKIKDQIGIGYKGVLTNFDALISEIEKLKQIHLTNIDFTNLMNLTNEDFVKIQKDFIIFADFYRESFLKFADAEKRIFTKFNLKEYDVRNLNIDDLVKKYQGCIDNIDMLDNWCEFVRLLNELRKLELKDFVDDAITQKLNPDYILDAYKKVFYMQWIDNILHESPTLLNLSRIPHDEMVKLFQTKDKLNFEINKAKIKAKLSMLRPNLDMVAKGSAIATLLRESEKKRKQKGIRLILEETCELVQTLKPCFLMSPLSVSTFLSSNMKFDVVVFDEASQIFPQDSIGAIYRGKQLIVVGDSKQMPPSNFFNNAANQDDNDDETDDVTDFESLLDICSTAFPQKRLKWHYRSRYEPLISFSNKNFYDNYLVTFPSSKQDCKGIGVDYFYVDGTFDRKSKTNIIEAEKVVDLVFENIKKYPTRSLGVVAFSISQQNLIDKLIAKRRQKDPSYEAFFKQEQEEAFFVKNLETVQGDQRDTIIFSIAYGKDTTGRLILNFGPLNREGGERRLNVAVTRAKYNVQLVCSMHYTDIDLSRTQSLGAKLLREYLDYAENGEIALERLPSKNPYEENDSEFEKEVYEFLKEKGFNVDTKVGCSSFKIDLALKHPNSSDYLLAIECDGTSYYYSKSTRDRDRLHQEILERMGWKFYRIWSTDWFRNKPLEKERLLEAVNKAMENINVKNEETSTNNVSFEEVAQTKHFQFPKYVMANEYEIARKYNYDSKKVIFSIIELESPICLEWLLKRIAFLFGREKVTNVVRDEFNYIMRNSSNHKIIRKNGFVYLQEKPILMLRVPSENASVIRDVKYICLEELALGMKEILKQNITVEKSGLFLLLVQQLGFNRIGDAMYERLEEALHLIYNEININGDILSLKQNN